MKAQVAGPLLLAVAMLGGCRRDMQDQPKITAQRGSEVFADHRGAREQLPNTVARGQFYADSYVTTGVVMGDAGYKVEKEEMPFPVTLSVLHRGQERFNVYCAPCHSRVGNGLGEVVQRGYKPAANLTDQVRRSQLLSHYFYTISHGYNSMPDYAAQISVEDRWAVAAYIRALQLSQDATPADLPPGVQPRELKDVAKERRTPWAATAWPLPAGVTHSASTTRQPVE